MWLIDDYKMFIFKEEQNKDNGIRRLLAKNDNFFDF